MAVQIYAVLQAAIATTLLIQNAYIGEHKMAQITWDGSTDGDVTVATNWQGDAVPQIGDDVIIPSNATVNIDGGAFDNAINSFLVEVDCSITIGTNIAPLVMTFAGQSDKTAVLGGTVATYIQTTAAAAVTVLKAATSGVGTNITSTDTTAILNMQPSNVGLVSLFEVTDGSIYTTINVTNGVLTIEPGVAFSSSTLNQSGGTVHNFSTSALTTLAQQSGTFNHNPTSAVITTLTTNGGTTFYNSSGTIVTLTVNGKFDLTKAFSSLTITNATIFENGNFNDPYGRATLTNGLKYSGTKVGDTTTDFGIDKTLTPS